jgi:hypothetical protein
MVALDAGLAVAVREIARKIGVLRELLHGRFERRDEWLGILSGREP